MIAGTEMKLLSSHTEYLLCFERSCEGRRLLVIANFSEREQRLSREFFSRSLFSHTLIDHLTDDHFVADQMIPPYATFWLEGVGV